MNEREPRTDHERTVSAAFVASASMVLVVAGFLLIGVSGVVGFALLALGFLGAIQAVLIGLGLVRIGGTGRRDG